MTILVILICIGLLLFTEWGRLALSCVLYGALGLACFAIAIGFWIAVGVAILTVIASVA